MPKLRRRRASPAHALILTCVVGLGVLAAALIPVLAARTTAGPASTAAAGTSEAAATIAQSGAIAKTSNGKTARTRVSSAPKTSIVVKETSASLGPLETIPESLNNCGPASVAAVLAYWHIYRTQYQVQAVLRADNSYWGMSPVDLPLYARSLGMRALVGYGGTEKLVKLLIANGFPVIASQYVSSSYLVRHYRPIESYNDRTGIFVSADPYLGAGHVITYAEFNSLWAESDYRFQVIYPPSRQAQLNAVLRAAGWNKTAAYEGAIRWEEAQMRTGDFSVVGSWIWANGYADVAFDEAQIGQYRKANAALAAATRQGVSQVLINWVRNDIRMLQG